MMIYPSILTYLSEHSDRRLAKNGSLRRNVCKFATVAAKLASKVLLLTLL
jgi:hypothetical protein